MKYTIERISPSSAAKVVSVTAALLFVVLLIVTLIVSVAQSSTDQSSPAIHFGNFGLAMILMPFVYMIGVYIATWIFSHAFNIATRLVGGIDVELSNR